MENESENESGKELIFFKTFKDKIIIECKGSDS